MSLKAAAMGYTDESIQTERERCREVFRCAYGKFRALLHGSKVKVQNPENFGISGGGHFDPVLWMRDFRLAAFHVLHGVQLEIFSLHYLDEFDRDRTMRIIGLRSGDSWNTWRHIIEEKVGSQLERNHLWPISEYAARNQELHELIQFEANRRPPRSSKKPDMDGN